MKMHKKQDNGRKEAAEEQHVKGKARGGCVSLANNEGQQGRTKSLALKASITSMSLS